MLRGSAEYQERVLAATGVAVLLCLALVGFILSANPFGGRSDSQLAVVINTPYVGQGVQTGTTLVLHGVTVGRVTNITSAPGGGVRLSADLEMVSVGGLTDTMGLDFRPVNYFGVTGVNLVSNAGGQELRNGSVINAIPKGNYTLSELLAQLGDVSEVSLTPQLIEVIDRVTRYTDGLNPLFETAVTVTRAMADVQEVPTEQLLANTASIATALPGFLGAFIEASTRITDYSYYPGQTFPAAATLAPKLDFPYLEGVKVPNQADTTEEYFQNVSLAFSRVSSEGLFASVGKVLYSHVDDLYPLITGLKAVTDIAPPLLRPQDIAQDLAELQSRFERLYAGNGDQRAISVRVLLDSLPGVAAPLGISLGDQQ
jgi:hypothetical protein